MTMIALQSLNDFTDIVMSSWGIHAPNVFRIDRVEFQNIVVHHKQGLPHTWFGGQRGIAQNAHTGLGAMAVAQLYGVFNDGFEIGMRRRFTIAGKSQHIWQTPFTHHLNELLLQFFAHLFARRTMEAWPMVGIEATLAIDAIERANLAVGRHEIDAQRNSQTATVDRTEDGRWIDNR